MGLILSFNCFMRTPFQFCKVLNLKFLNFSLLFISISSLLFY
nr:MAG TPA: hypothetical protein [Caudoviricetes sp.]